MFQRFFVEVRGFRFGSCWGPFRAPGRTETNPRREIDTEDGAEGLQRPPGPSRSSRREKITTEDVEQEISYEIGGARAGAAKGGDDPDLGSGAQSLGANVDIGADQKSNIDETSTKNRKSPGASGSLWGASGGLQGPPKTPENPKKP